MKGTYKVPPTTQYISMALIHDIHARWILDSRGLPTVYCTVTLDQNGRKTSHTASVPSGASTGSYEALELRDGESEFHGKGVSKAIEHINTIISTKTVGRDFTTASELDQHILSLDTSSNKSELGANAILGVSMAAHRAYAALAGLELWQYLRRLYFSSLPANSVFPRLMCNVLNGGAHADNGLSVQEFMIIPNAQDIEDDIRIASEIYHTLKKTLHKDGYSTALGDEGGFAPTLNLQTIVQHSADIAPELNPTKVALNYLQKAITDTGYTNISCELALDVAATEFFNSTNEIYEMDGKQLSRSDLGNMYQELVATYPIVSIEDGFSEDDILGWEIMTQSLGKKIHLIGDDLFVTNPKRFQEIGLKNTIANGVLIKLNQIGSVLETCQMINDAKDHGYITSISHRSGETTDSFISDLAFASQSEFIKLGAPARGERVVKYNRLLEIRDSLHA
jgi:enolase